MARKELILIDLQVSLNTIHKDWRAALSQGKLPPELQEAFAKSIAEMQPTLLQVEMITSYYDPQHKFKFTIAGKAELIIPDWPLTTDH